MFSHRQIQGCVSRNKYPPLFIFVSDGTVTTKRSLKDFGFVAIDHLTPDEIRSKGLLSVSAIESSTHTESGNSTYSGSQPKRSCRGRPKVVTLLPPSSPSGKPQGRPGKYVNWFSDGLFPPIVQAMKDTRGNYTKCLKLLKARYKNGLTNRSPYSALSRSTLSSWFDSKTRKLLPHVKRYAEVGTPYDRNRRFSIFGSTEVVEGLKELVERQREAGMYLVLLCSMTFLVYLPLLEDMHNTLLWLPQDLL